MLDPEALELAASRTGMTVEEIANALVAFRHVAEQLHAEPDWIPLCHISFSDMGLANWRAEGTAVTKQVETPRTRDGGWGKGEVYFVYQDEAYETYGEARAAELRSAELGGVVVAL